MKRNLLLFATLLLPIFLAAQINDYNPRALEKAEETIAAFKAKDTKFETYFKDAYAYVVFPSVGKDASGIGGAFGTGIVFEQKRPIGKAILSQISVGIQFEGQAYQKVIFFETEDDLQRFKENKLEFAGGASAILLKEGIIANLSYRDGVAVFVIAKAGLMYEAALGGQKLKFKPFRSI